MDFQYSPADQLGTQVFVDYSKQKKTIGAGIGAYTKRSVIPSGYRYFDIYGGYSFNEFHFFTKRIPNSYSTKFRYDDVYLSGGVQFRYENVGISFQLKPHMTFIRDVTLYGEISKLTLKEIDVFKQSPFLLFDSSLGIEIGIKPLVIFGSVNYSGSNKVINPFIDRYSLSVGLNIDINTLLN